MAKAQLHGSLAERAKAIVSSDRAGGQRRVVALPQAECALAPGDHVRVLVPATGGRRPAC